MIIQAQHGCLIYNDYCQCFFHDTELESHFFGAMHIIYYISRLKTTKVDLTYFDYQSTAHNVYVSWRMVGADQ